jgi:hypothetical protein
MVGAVFALRHRNGSRGTQQPNGKVPVSEPLPVGGALSSLSTRRRPDLPRSNFNVSEFTLCLHLGDVQQGIDVVHDIDQTGSGHGFSQSP